MRINIWAALLLTALALCGTLRNGWVYLDDMDLVLENDSVIHFNLKDIWLNSNTATYVPLTVSTFAVEYSLAGEKPLIYHINNLLLHLLVVWLVYRLCTEFGLSSNIAATAALIFGVHPMHVESVAWIAERKDVLYSVFYLCALSMYLRYAKLTAMQVENAARAKRLLQSWPGRWPAKWVVAGRRRAWWLAFIALILALYSKSMALSFPFVALLIDWWVGRKRSLGAVVDKIPFVLAAVCVSSVTFYKVMLDIQKASVILPEWEDRILYFVASAVWYPGKFLAPVNLSPIYVFPSYVNTDSLYYQISLVAMIGWIYAIWLWRRNRLWVFANMFYILSAWFLWRFDNSDFHNVADRFMYLPSLGYCLLIATWLQSVSFQMHARIQKLVIVVLIVFMVTASNGAARHWHSEYSIYKRALRVTPDSLTVRKKMANYYRSVDDYQREMDETNEALKQDPDSIPWTLRRARIWEENNDPGRAYIDYTRVCHLYSYYNWIVDDNYHLAARKMWELQSQSNRSTGATKVIKGGN